MRRLMLLTGLASLASLGTANAGVVTYTNLAAWQTAAGASTNETFTASSPGNLSTGGAFGPVAFTGFSLSGNGNGDRVAITTGAIANGGTDTPIPGSFAGQNYLAWGNINGGTPPTLTFTFDTPVKSFGFDWFNTDVTDQDRLSLTPNEGGPYSGPPFTFASGNTASSGFFGVVSDNPLTSFTISIGAIGGYVSDRGVDNVRIAAAPSNVPEPATLAVFGLMAAGGAGYVRRRAKAKA